MAWKLDTNSTYRKIKSVEFLRLNLSTMGVSDPYPDQEKAWMVDASRTHRAATEENKADKF